MIRTLTILASLPFLAGCNIQDIIDPGADSQRDYEYRQSLLIQPANEAQKPIHIEADVHSEPVKPVCVITFRINRCDDQGNETDWYYL